MRPHLRQGQTLDAGSIGDILHGFETGTPWMPKQHSAAEAVSFCAMMIDRGWVTLAELAGDEQDEQDGRVDYGDHVVRPAIRGFIARDEEEVHALYVRPGWTGRGIGKALLQDAMARSPRLWLWTFQANHGAQKFYLREGFVESRRTDGAGNDEGLPDIQYSWPAEAT
ncbi:MAG: GNAT family N-acetyltransferase [Pseudomonadota bacterium]